jgi:hypothetical protein
VELRKRSKGWDGMVLAPTHANETITCCLEAYQAEDAMWLRKKNSNDASACIVVTMINQCILFG